MGEYNFEKDLTVGERFEREVLEFLNSRNFDTERVYRKEEDPRSRKHYDLKNGVGTMIECKLDEQAHITGNLFFETFDLHGYKAGVLSSWAQYFIYGVRENRTDVKMVHFNTNDCIRFLLRFPCTLKPRSGDNKMTEGVTVPVDTFLGQPFVGQIQTIRGFYE